MKKLLTAVFLLMFTLSASAKGGLKGSINSVITQSEISKPSISVSVKHLFGGKPAYELNEKTLMHPASVQKILTLPAFMEVLSDDYEFSTQIFGRNNGEYLVKLGADPFLSSSDLKTLAGEIDKQTVTKISIDDTVIEPKDWGEGWQWDDDLNTSMPRFNSYNLDDNLIKITVMPKNGTASTETMVINPSKYPLVFFNDVIVSDRTDVKVSRDSSISTNTLTLSGTVSKPCMIYIPTNNLRRYFNIKLTQVLSNRNIYLKENFTPSKKQSSDKLLCEIKHPISNAEEEILKNSNNMVIETVGKLAASKAYNKTGTDVDAIKVFDEYCKKHSIDNSKIRIVDASGVSKNNLIYADFVTEYLVKSKNNPTLAKMAKPGEGTLSARMLPLKDNLTAKTGTLSDISSIAGYLTSKSGNKYAFCIIINDPITTKSEKANLEDYIIRELYLKG